MTTKTKEVGLFNFKDIVEAMEYLSQEELELGEDHWGDGDGTYSLKCELFQTDPGYQLVVTSESNIWEDC